MPGPMGIMLGILTVGASGGSPGVRLTLTSEDGPYVNDAFTVTATFSEAVTWFTVDSISATNATISEFAGSGKVYTFTVTPTAEGPVTLSVVALDYEYDVTAPTVAITSDASGTVTEPFEITITFSEPVVGFALDSLTVGNGTASNLATEDDTVFTATITPAEPGAVTVDIAADAVTDRAGNGNEAATQFSIDYVYYVAEGPIVITPTETETVDDGGFENWTSPTDLTNWNENVSGSSSVGQETEHVHGGTSALRITVDANNSTAQVHQSAGVRSNSWHIFSIWVKMAAGDPLPKALIFGTTNYSAFIPADTEYKLCRKARWVGASTGPRAIGRYQTSGVQNKTFYVDDASDVVVSDIAQVIPWPMAHFKLAATLTPAQDLPAGLRFNQQDAQNYDEVYLFHDYSSGAEKVYFDKVRTGVRANVGNYVVAYAEGGELAVIQKQDGTIRIEYDGQIVADELEATGLAAEGNSLGIWSITDEVVFGGWSVDSGAIFDDKVVVGTLDICIQNDVHVAPVGHPSGDDGRNNLTAWVTAVNSLEPDLTVSCGDLAMAPGEGDEDAALIIAALTVPHAAACGNHDIGPAANPATVKQQFFERYGRDASYYAFDLDFARCIVLDSCFGSDDSSGGHYQGYLPDFELDWLDNEITSTTKDTVLVFMHHPPIELDGDVPAFNPDDLAALAAILAQHNNVWVFTGHWHKSAVQQHAFGASTLYILPPLINGYWTRVTVRKYISGACSVSVDRQTIVLPD